MTNPVNLYQRRVWKAYCDWLAVYRDKDSLYEIAKRYNVDPWDIELQHRTETDE